MDNRTILHINIVNYFIAIARMREPGLDGYPVAVRASGSRRVLMDVSKEAQDAGVTRGMIVETAKRMCPDLVVTDPDPCGCEKTDNYLLQKASSLSPLTEMAGPGHLFVDLTGTRRLNGAAVDVADSVRKSILDDTRIVCAVGLAANRLVSKVATRVVKPGGLCSVINGCEKEFISPLPVQFLPGIEKRILTQLQQFNLHLIRDLNEISVKTLASVLGTSANDISRSAHGIDDTPVRDLVTPAPAVDESVTFGDKTNDDTIIAGNMFSLVSRACARIRKMGLATGAITVSITYADGARSSRSVKLMTPVRCDLTLFEHCSLLLSKILVRRVRVAAMSILCTELMFPYGQLDLFSDSEKEENLMNAIDSIRSNFGTDAIRFWGREKTA